MQSYSIRTDDGADFLKYLSGAPDRRRTNTRYHLATPTRGRPTTKLAQNKCKLHTHQLLPFFLFFFFLDAFASLESLLFPPNPYFSSSFLATLLICLNRAGPKRIPPYHRLTTHTAFSTFIISRRCIRRPPAAVSPSSSLSEIITPFGCTIRSAQMLCVALAILLSAQRKCINSTAPAMRPWCDQSQDVSCCESE